MSEGLPKSEAPKKSDETFHGSKQEMPLSEQLHGLVEFANLSPEELRTELRFIIERIKALEETSRTDELTGLLNRRGLGEEIRQLEAIFAREREKQHVDIPTAFLAIDLDGFKQVNDTSGHAAGDRCLRLIAEQVKAVLRESDIFARIGGDEFGIFLTDCDEAGAFKVARAVRSVLEESVTEVLRREFPGYAGEISASIGVSTSRRKDSPENREHVSVQEMMRHADYAAYVVKAAGKKGELTASAAREADADHRIERDFLAGKSLPR